MAEEVITNQDAANLYNSCVDMQRSSFGFQQEIQLSKLVTKLKNWVTPITEAKQKFAKTLGFTVNGSQFIYGTDWDVATQTAKLTELNDNFTEVEKQPFEQSEELKAMLPLSLFTPEKMEHFKFIEGQQKQAFIEYCIVK